MEVHRFFDLPQGRPKRVRAYLWIGSGLWNMAAKGGLVMRQYRMTLAVVQWIERLPPKRQIQVRFLSAGPLQNRPCLIHPAINVYLKRHI